MQPTARTAVLTPPKPGTVEGDVYLTMQSGDVKKGAGLKVRIMDRPNEVVLAIQVRCAAWKRYLEGEKDPATRLAHGPQLERDLAEILSTNVIAETGTGMNAHYKFENLPAGEYLLFAAFRIGDNNYRWLVPASVTPGSSLTIDLDTEKENSSFIGCGWN